MLHFKFKISDNDAGCKALIMSLELARRLDVEYLRIHCDSQLIVNQVKDNYTTKEPHMVVYLEKTHGSLEALSWFEIL